MPSPSIGATPSPAVSAPPTAAPTPTASGAPAPARAQLDFKPAETIVSGLTAPWAFAFNPDGSIWITERGGQVRVLRDGRLLPDPAARFNVSIGTGLESGLLGLELKPPHAYVYYSYRSGAGAVSRVSELTIEGDRLTGERILLDGIPGGSCCHFGGRLRLGPDGYLYIGAGDGQVPSRAAQASGLNGRVLRLRLDGSGPETYAYGLRNPQGLAFDPQGRLWVADNGPTGEFGFCCHDRIDLIQQGGYYGWPAIAGSVPTGQPGAANPLPAVVESGTAVWAPSGATFYSPAPNEAPDLVFAGLRGQALFRLHGGQVQSVFSGAGRMRDAQAGPGNCLYALTNNTDSRGSPRPGDDRLIKLCPA